MKYLLALSLAAIVTMSTAPADTITLNASGATFPAPLYNRWFADYSTAHPDVRINYQGIGSGAGIKQFTGGLTDFGASDAAMSDKEIAAVTQGGVVLLPMTAGSIVLSYNVPGLTAPIMLPREVYPAIFLGKITKWNDPKIVAANPGVTMPDLPITVAYRADGSGTTFNFTSHLAAISPDFKASPGAGKQVKFPVGVGGKGNDGVAALIKQTPGTIGYVEYGYAQHSNLPMATLQNAAGKYVAPSADSGSAALAQVDLPGKPPRVRDRSHRRHFLSHRDFHLVALPHHLHQARRGRCDQGARDLVPDGRPKDSPPTSVTFPCPPRLSPRCRPRSPPSSNGNGDRNPSLCEHPVGR